MAEDDFQIAQAVVDLESVMLIFFLLYICLIDQAWGQEGWILAKFLFAFFRLQDKVEVNKNAKKNRAILTEQFWSIKDLSYGQKENFFLRDWHVKSWAAKTGLILPAQVADQNTGFASSCLHADSTI